MLGVIAAQQSRAARPNRHAARDGLDDGVRQFPRLRETQIVVRREIDSVRGFERPQTAPAQQRIERTLMIAGHPAVPR